jgi:hypothetical protein
VQVAVEPGQGSRLVAAEAQGVFERGDQAAPLAGERERQCGDEGEAPGDLASPDAGEQPLALQVDPGVDKGGGDALVISSLLWGVSDVALRTFELRSGRVILSGVYDALEAMSPA